MQYDLYALKRGNLDTDMDTERMPCEYGGKDQNDASTNQGTPNIARKPPEAKGEAWHRFSFTALRTN